MSRKFLLSLLLSFSAGQLQSVDSCDLPDAVIAKASTHDWPSYGLNNENLRNPLKTKIKKKNVADLSVDWSYETFGALLCNPAIVDNIAYLGDAFGFIYALDATTGALIWQTNLGSLGPAISNGVTQAAAPYLDLPSIFLTPTVGTNKIYFLTFNAFVVVLDRSSGAILQYKLLQDNPTYPQAGYSSVNLFEENDQIIVSLGSFEPQQTGQTDAASGVIYSLQASDITIQKWKLDTSDNPSSPLTTGGSGVGITGTAAYDAVRNRLIIGTGNNWKAPVTPIADSLLSLDASTGAIDWHLQFTDDDIAGIPNPCSPTGVSGKNWDVLMSPILLTHKVSSSHCIDIVVVGQKSGMLHAVNRADGTCLWNTVLTNPNPDGSGFGGVNTSGCSDGDVVYVPSHYSTDGLPLAASFSETSHIATGIFAVRVRDGHILWRADVPGMTVGPLTVANDILYHTAYDGVLRAFDAKNGKVLFEYSDSDTLTLHLSGGTTVHKDRVYLPTGNAQTFTPGKLVVFKK